MSQYQKGKTNLDFTEARDSDSDVISRLPSPSFPDREISGKSNV